MLKNNSAKITIGIICFLLVFMMTIQIRTINESESDILRLKRENELRDEIGQWKDMYSLSTGKIDELNKKLEEYRNAASTSNQAVAEMKNDLDNISILAGLTTMKGPGIEVILDDTRALEQIMMDAGYYDPMVYVIHDTDILLVINELRAAGAEAISINGQRITSNTEVRCVGPVVSVNTAKIAAPFIISAIGEADNLASALNLRGGVVDAMKQAKIDVTIEKKSEIIVPEYSKVIKYQYATPAEKGE